MSIECRIALDGNLVAEPLWHRTGRESAFTARAEARRARHHRTALIPSRTGSMNIPSTGTRSAGTGGEAARSLSNSLENTPAIEPDSIPTSGDEEEDSAERSSTQSLTNSVWNFEKENGRTYHGYRAGAYHYPNDSTENERLDFQHFLLSCVMDGKLHLAPIVNPKRILDIGTGTGIWAIEMGDQYPESKIEGTDLSPIQPTAVPDNVQFLIDDAEQEDWAVPLDYYDFIHTRMMLGSFDNFRSIIGRSFKYLKPGGWMESQDLYIIPQCDDNSMPDDWAFKEWTAYMDDAAMDADRPLRTANKLKRWYTEAGFVDVHEKVYRLPINGWPRDPKLKQIGIWWEQSHIWGLQGFSLAHFTRVLGWSKDELEVYLVDVRKSLGNKHVHAYHKFYVVWGRKPEAPLCSSPENFAEPQLQLPPSSAR